MLNRGIAWRDYEGMAGFGSAPLSPGQINEVNQLNKALMAGNAINNPGVSPGEGFPLRVESLESTLKNVTERMEHIRFWKALTKLPAVNTIEEYNRITSYGDGDDTFISEGALPSEEDSTYERETVKIKFMGTTRRVSHPMTLVKAAHGNVIAAETISGTMHLLRKLETALFEADSDLSSLQFDGLRKMITERANAANIIDLRGGTLDEDKLVDASLIISDAPNFGTPTHFHLNPKAKADLVKTLFPRARFDQFKKPDNGYVGLDIAGYTSPAGDVQFESNVHITDGGAPPAAATAGAQAALVPGAPTNSTGSTTPSGGADSLFVAGDVGSYEYYVVAHNDYGHSAALFIDTAAIAVAAGDKVTFGVTPAGGIATKWFNVYRTKKSGVGASNARLIQRIPNDAGSGETVFEDYNADLPFTTNGYLWQQNLEVMSWKQLAPFLKIPLATVDTSIRWAQVVYGAVALYAENKTVLFKNIGRAAGSLSV